MILNPTELKRLACVLVVVTLCIGSGVITHVYDKMVALEAYKTAIEARDIAQAQLNINDLKLAELQRAKHEQRAVEVIKTEVKWLNAPAAVKQSCADSGLYEITDAVLGTNRPTGNTQ